MTHTVTTDNYSTKVLNDTELPILLKVGAEWCGPCQIMNPIIEELKTDLAGSVNVYTADTDESPHLADDLDIESVPTFIVYRDGVKLAQTTGVFPKVVVLNWLYEALAQPTDSAT
jgi:thioredoxin 1